MLCPYNIWIGAALLPPSLFGTQDRLVPEGDTIWRAARTLGAALGGKEVTAFSSPLPQVAGAARRLRVVGSRVEAVDPVGKHLLMRFSTGGCAA